ARRAGSARAPDPDATTRWCAGVKRLSCWVRRLPAEGAGGAFRKLQFRQRKQEGQCRFGAVVLVDTIHMKGVPAAAGAGGIDLDVEIVPTEEPAEGRLRLLVPPPVGCGTISLKAGRDRCLRLDGLLVEIRAGLAARIKPIASHGPEIAALRGLDLRQPAKCLQT